MAPAKRLLALLFVGTSTVATSAYGHAATQFSRCTSATRLGGLLVILVLAASTSQIEGDARANPDPSLHGCFGRRATIVGTPGNDRIRGTSGSDVIVGLAGRDQIRAGAGNDFICAGRGRATQDDTEIVYAGAGADHVDGGRGGDAIAGGRGHDEIRTGDGHNLVAAGAGSDRVVGGPGEDELNGGAGDDSLYGRGWFDIVDGGRGNDLIVGGADGSEGDYVDYFGPRSVDVSLADGVSTGRGRDRLLGIENVIASDTGDTVIGNGKANLLYGSLGDDRLAGGGGDDCIFAGAGDNSVDGGGGFDHYTANALWSCARDRYPGTVTPVVTSGISVDLATGQAFGSAETTLLTNIEGAFGTSDEDVLIGNEADNVLYGAGASDELRGDAGNDMLDGAGGLDRLDGGPGTDRCINGEVAMSCE